MEIQCPHCNLGLEIEEEHYGQRVCCSECENTFIVPMPDIEPERTITEADKDEAKKMVNVIKKKKKIRKRISEVKEFQEPILAVFFRIFAYISLILTVITLASAIIFLNEGNRGTAIGLVPIFISSLFSMIINFGLSQIVGFLGKTAFYAEKVSIQLDAHNQV
jgi:DNA-directed RNA polymerase subunit M/transcription elongation factor TFIIS